MRLGAVRCKTADDLALQMEFVKLAVVLFTGVDVSDGKWNGTVCVEPLIRVTKLFCVVVSIPETRISSKRTASRLTVA